MKSRMIFGNADAEGNGVNGIFVRRIGGNIPPLLKIESAERSVRVFRHNLSLALKEKRKRAASGADIHSLPEPVQH
jgi:hypothetical protein